MPARARERERDGENGSRRGRKTAIYGQIKAPRGNSVRLCANEPARVVHFNVAQRELKYRPTVATARRCRLSLPPCPSPSRHAFERPFSLSSAAVTVPLSSVGLIFSLFLSHTIAGEKRERARGEIDKSDGATKAPAIIGSTAGATLAVRPPNLLQS